MPTVIPCVDIACLVDFRQYLLSMLGSESLYVGERSPRHTHDYAANAPWYSICSQNILLLSVGSKLSKSNFRKSSVVVCPEKYFSCCFFS
jgi:hypothetical protein